MKKAFTLIELMIVVAIIAIIAAIAIPNLLESRIQANESAAIGSLKTAATAQTTYQKANYSRVNGLASKLYANPYTNLGAHTKGDSSVLTLIPPAMVNAAAAFGAAPAAASQGYAFVDAVNQPNAAVALNQSTGFGLYAHPVTYGQSGNNTYAIYTDGQVYYKDQGGTSAEEQVLVAANNWEVP